MKVKELLTILKEFDDDDEVMVVVDSLDDCSIEVAVESNYYRITQYTQSKKRDVCFYLKDTYEAIKERIESE